MPARDFQPEEFFILGQDGKYKLGRITDLEFPETSNEKPHMHMPFSNEPIEFEMELDKPIGSRTMIFLLTGKWYSNNWLRMHGLPMERRRRKGRR